MNNIVDGMIIILEFLAVGVVTCIAIDIVELIAIDIVEEVDRRKEKKAKAKKERRKEQFKAECEAAGRNLMNADSVKAFIHSSSKKQKVKYVGLFSGKEVEELMKYGKVC